MIRTINPFDQSVVGEFQTLDAGALNAKIELAGQTFKKWKKTTFVERREGASKLSWKVIAESVVLPWRLAARRDTLPLS